MCFFLQEVLLSGIQKIEVEDWKANTVYTDCDPATPVVQVKYEVLSLNCSLLS
ncbi:hypothetical protein DPMN_053004 [Dreissena polymorpha]|uniref:Uncharacterized protein n=1 Tax=Dreissena polymorpha TaxID=45954 RepID=A0A9D4HRR9_DREPO|nr:hypothetical protein DPMN_053004 [Dreissena polymorpha]